MKNTIYIVPRLKNSTKQKTLKIIKTNFAIFVFDMRNPTNITIYSINTMKFFENKTVTNSSTI